MKSFRVLKQDNQIVSSILDIDRPVPKDNEVLIKVSFSNLNYKDALSSKGHPGITRQFPHTTGIDAVGVIEESGHSDFKKGDSVLVTGYDLGMNTDGGHAEYVCVPSSWCIALPEGLTDLEAAYLGTAGLTSALSVMEIESYKGDTIKGEQVLVTGASGQVGQMAIQFLDRLGCEVSALTSKVDQKGFLKKLGAAHLLDRESFSLSSKPLLKSQWGAIVDTVGGETLAELLKQTKPYSVVTCCGLVDSEKLNTTVFPFILRGLRLIGIDSAECPLELRKKAWEKMSQEWKPLMVKDTYKIVGLKDLPDLFQKMTDGGVGIRIIVDPKLV